MTGHAQRRKRWSCRATERNREPLTPDYFREPQAGDVRAFSPFLAKFLPFLRAVVDAVEEKTEP
jgi:hypothetical protein